MRDIKHIVIHCSASANGDATVDRARIDEWHKAKGWRGIGYHYVVELDGRLAVGRPEEAIGAHVAGQNASSIGICMVGTDRFSRAQWETLKELVHELVLRYPAAEVLGHRDFSPDQDGDGVIEPWEWFKTCPGFDVRAWIAAAMDPEWEVRHLYTRPQASVMPNARGFGTVQAAIALAALGLLSALAWGAKAYVERVHAEGLDAGRRAALLEVGQRDNAQLAAVQKRILELQAALASAEERHRSEVARIDQEGTDAIRTLEHQRDAARRSARDLAQRLRDPGRAESVACPAGGGGDRPAEALAGAGVGDAGGEPRGAELSRAAAEFLQREAARADEVAFKLNRTIVQLEACQQILVDDRRT